MGRRSYSRCAVRNGEVEYNDAGKPNWLRGVSWCKGDRTHSLLHDMAEGEDPHAFSRRSATCNKCSAAIGKVRFAQIADRVQVVPLPVSETRYGKVYRSFNSVVIDGQEVGFILMDNGWGNTWELHELTADDQRRTGGRVSHTPGSHSRVNPDNVFQQVHSWSREMMASAALRLRDQGGLRTLAEQAAQREENKRRQAEDDAKREIERAEMARQREARDARTAERKTLALDGLAAVLQRPDLSNIERAGVEAARDIIEGKSA